MGLGSLIYQSACPYLVKKHADWADYVRSDGPSLNSDQVLALARILHIQGPADIIKSIVMQHWYAEESNKYAIIRLCVAVFFYSGLILLAIPSILSAFKIAKLFAEKLNS